MTVENDFSKLDRFPGETGNLFDIFLHRLNDIDRIPGPLFGVLLFVIAAAVTRLTWSMSLILWGFYMVDWLLVALLPRFERSFGPAQPPVFLLAVLRSVFFLLPQPWNFVLEGLGTLLVIYGFWIEPHQLTITQQNLETIKLPSGSGIRVLHLGDIHVERITRRERELQAQIERLKPDLILFSGDILNLSYRTDPTAIEHARWVIGQWKAPLGVYMVSGSPAVDLPETMPKLMEGLPVHWLKYDKVSLQVPNATIDVVGLTCTHRPYIDGPKLTALVPQPPEHFTILLYHTPDLAPVAARLGVDLQFSGHTHGGQVRIPGFGALVTGSLYGKRFESGRKEIGPLTLYVSRGIGMEGAAAPRVRLFCPPEIILWNIQGKG
jgi:uncharacterized protein